MSREVLDRWCERGILALVLTLLVFGPLALGAVRALEFSIIQGLTVGVMLLWGCRLWVGTRPRFLWPPVCWAVLAFTIYAIARYLTADVEYIARIELLHVLVYTFLFFAILNNLHRQETIQIMTITLVFLAMVLSFYALYQFLTGSDRVWMFKKPYAHRGSGTYISPNHLAGFLEMLLPLGLAYAWTGRLKPVTRILLGYAALVILAGIAVTVSRGSWLSTGSVLLLFFGVLLLNRKYRLPAALVLLIVAAVTPFAFSKSFFVQKRMNELVRKEGTVDDDMRFALWQPAVQMWKDNPWCGVGPGLFDSRFRSYRPEGVQASPDRTHNDYLNTLADYGIIGTALVGVFLGLLGWGVARTWRSVRLSSGDLGGKSGSNKFAYVFGASLGLVAILIHSVVDFNMHIPANALLAVALMAWLSSHLRFATEQYWFGLRPWSKGLTTAALLAGMTYLLPQAWRQGSEFVWLNRAASAPSFSAAQAGLLQKAFAVEPRNGLTAYKIGEALRRQSQEGAEFYTGQQGVNYRNLAEQAMGWFDRASKLNPYDSRPFSGYGWCLDWLERQAESQSYFDHAEELDPNNYYNLNNIGLHYIQVGDFAAARPLFERSLRLESQDNPIAHNYLRIANARLMEAATNELSARLNAVPR
jgi:O-antigen ligase